MVHACGAGAVDFATWRQTKLDWLGLEIRLQAYENRLIADVAGLDARRHIGTMSVAGLNQKPEVLQDFAIKGIETYRAALLPWYGVGSHHNYGDAIDDTLDWYMTFRPDLITKALK